MNKDTQSWSNSNLTEMEELLQKVQQLERENAALKVENADIVHAYGVTRDVVKGLCEELANLKTENAALREDKERLDSGMIKLRAFSEWGNEWCLHTRLDLRAAIDAARKEGQL